MTDIRDEIVLAVLGLFILAIVELGPIVTLLAGDAQ
jgi:hypothetical protein